jgi:hypothetical protein
MTDRDKKSFHIIFNILLVVLIATLETSFWQRVLSPIPNPQLWLSVVVFVFLYRSPLESLMIVYVPSLFIYLLTMNSLGSVILAQTILYFLVLAVRTRIFVPGQFYYSVLYSSAVLVFHILMYTLSYIFEGQPLSGWQVLGWFVQSILAFVISPILYSGIKLLTPIEEVIDTGGNSYL